MGPFFSVELEEFPMFGFGEHSEGEVWGQLVVQAYCNRGDGCVGRADNGCGIRGQYGGVA